MRVYAGDASTRFLAGRCPPRYSEAAETDTFTVGLKSVLLFSLRVSSRLCPLPWSCLGRWHLVDGQECWQITGPPASIYIPLYTYCKMNFLPRWILAWLERVPIVKFVLTLMFICARCCLSTYDIHSKSIIILLNICTEIIQILFSSFAW